MPEYPDASQFDSLVALLDDAATRWPTDRAAYSLRTDDGIVMAIEHEKEAIAAVQFHPESIMSLDQDAGHKIIENVVTRLVASKDQQVAAAS